jgi:MSHA biogenesis protein MshI
MQWPWKRAISKDQFIVSWCAQELAYVEAHLENGRFHVKRMGVEAQGADKLKDFAARLAGKGIGGGSAIAMLTTEQSMLLQIAAPAVPPEELRAAVRYQIRDMVDQHIDDLTVDVLHVGDGQDKSSDQVFVVAAANAVIRDVMQLTDAMEWSCRVIDVQEMAQRNLQSAWARTEGIAERATAALFVVDDKHALLTVSAGDELYYSRRLDLPEGFMAMQWDGSARQAVEAVDAYTPVDEYVPDYGAPASAFGADDHGLGDNDRAQRLLVELQRSLDLWDRTHTQLPMAAVGVYAGLRTDELAGWLGRGLGQPVAALNPASLFDGVPPLDDLHNRKCLPLLGVLLRSGGNS